jgi:hypothetical protein
MSFVKSLFFGSEGSYNILGVPVTFQKGLPNELTYPSRSDLLSQIVRRCINNEAVRILTFTYAHVFVHEMCHALTCKLLTSQAGTVVFSANPFCACSEYPDEFQNASPWKQTVIAVAGPMGGIAFSTCQLVAAIALKSYISWPIALVLSAGAVLRVAGELIQASTDACSGKHGDFGGIRYCRGKIHLALASLALVTQCALGVFAAIKLRG